MSIDANLGAFAPSGGAERAASRPLAAEPVTTLEWAALAGVLVLAVVLRAVGLNAPLWYDEILTLLDFIRLPYGTLIQSYGSMNNHVLFSLEAKAAVGLFGEHAWSLRLPAVIFGVAGVAATWALGRQIAGRAVGLTAALLLALSYHHVWFSQNARGYTELLFFTIVGTMVFVRGLQKPDWKVWSLFAVLFAVSMYTHLSAVFFLVSQGLVVAALWAWKSRKDVGEGFRWALWPITGFVLGGVLTLILFSPMLSQMVSTFGSVGGGDTGGGAEAVKSAGGAVKHWENPLWTITEVARSLADLGLVGAVAVPLALVLMGIGGTVIAKRHPAAVACYAIHIPLTLALLLAAGFRIWPRYFFVDAGFAFVALTAGVFWITDRMAPLFAGLLGRERAPTVLAGLAALAMALASATLLPKNYALPKQDFEGAERFILANRAPGDVVASYGLAVMPLHRYYAPDWAVVEDRKALDALVARPGRVWLVEAFPEHAASRYPDIQGALGSEFELVKKFPGTLEGGRVTVYRSKS